MIGKLLAKIGIALCALGLHRWEKRKTYVAQTIRRCKRYGCREFKVTFPPIPKRRAY